MIVRSVAIRWVMSVLVAANAVAQVASSAAADDRVPLKLSDLYEVTSASSAVLTPDERRVVFTRQWIDKATSQERSSLWSGAGAGMPGKALESGEPDARLPIVSPDGRWVVIRSTRPRPDGWRQTPPVPAASEPATDIWFVPIDGGPAIPLAGAEKPYGRVFIDPFYARVAFSPDGRQLVFVADDGVDPRTAQELEANVEIVRPDQGEGYTGYRPAQIWVADLPDLAKLGAAPQPTTASTPTKTQTAATSATTPTASSAMPSHMATRIRRLSPDDAWYGDPQWSPDGKSIVVHANRTDDRESVRFSINKNYDLWSLDVSGASPPRQLTAGPGPEVSPRWSPDGRRLACLSSPRKGPHADVFNLAIVDASAPTPRMTVVHDHHAVEKSEEQGEESGAEKRPYPQFPLADDCWLSNERLVFTAPLGVTS
ncbi:MAG TPA: hypothetical protein PLV92_24975, partial [Pirellulaceae bacterium]|nr:hypothetical protein [Pirellulaceae bacterium]